MVCNTYPIPFSPGLPVMRQQMQLRCNRETSTASKARFRLALDLLYSKWRIGRRRVRG